MAPTSPPSTGDGEGVWLAHGPAYLLDVVGIDTGHHAGDVMAQGFTGTHEQGRPHRHRRDVRSEPLRSEERQGLLRLRAGQEGQAEEGGRRRSYELLAPIAKPKQDFDKDAIIARMMIPMINEVVLCLEEALSPRQPKPTSRWSTVWASLPSAAACSAIWTPWSGSLRGHGRPVCRFGPALPRQRQAARDGRPGQNLYLIAERRSIHERRSHCRLYPDPDGPVQGRRLPQRACRRFCPRT